MKIIFSENGYRFIWLSVTPVVLLHLFFLNYSVHDFTVLYASLFFSVLMGILYDKVKKSGAISIRRMQIGLVIIVALLVTEYELMNHLPFKHDSLSYFYKVGTNIKNQTQKDELLFTTDTEVPPQIIYYSHRNICYAKDEAEAQAFADSRKIKKWEIISFEDNAGTPQVHFEKYSREN